MAKLFITLYIMVISSFGVFLLYVTGIFTLGESIGYGAMVESKISKGTLTLLNKSFINLDQKQTEELLEQYRKIFGDDFSLVEMATLDLDNEEIEAVKQGKIVFEDETITTPKEEQEEDDEVKILYFQKPNSSKVWRIELDYELDLTVNESGLSIGVESGKFAEGMMFLLQQEFLLEEQNEWSGILTKLQSDFGLPLKLIDLNTVTKVLESKGKDKELSLLQENNIINITQGTELATFVHKIPNSPYLLQVGPVEIPWYIRNAPYLFLFAFILAFATTLFLWLWPLWSSLIGIKKAADDFGLGIYSARIPYKRWSPIGKVSKAFNAMAERTQNSIQAQKELTSAVSHELRTPVARMRFALEMLESGDDPKEKKRFVNDLNTDINELDLLLEELLSYARLDQAGLKLNFTNNKLFPWIKDSMEKLELLADDKNLSFVIQHINADEIALFESRMMTRVLDNLVQNALRYAIERVEVRFSKDQKHYRIIVDDDGAGIAENEREKVFEAFSRIDVSRDRASGGFGLGLAIANRIIKVHQGEITISDSNLGGARFDVSWPIKL